MVDENMIGLAKLIAGQKSNKKKKSKPKSFRPIPSSQFRFAKFDYKPPASYINRANSYSNSHSFQDVNLKFFLFFIINLK